MKKNIKFGKIILKNFMLQMEKDMILHGNFYLKII